MKPSNTDHQTQLVHHNTLQVPSETKITGPRVILATVIQESQGYVHVSTNVSLNSIARNPGLIITHCLDIFT